MLRRLESEARADSTASVAPVEEATSAIWERRTAVRRSRTSATTEGEGGRGTDWARERARAGVRVKAERARVVAGSTSSESSLRGVECQFLVYHGWWFGGVRRVGEGVLTPSL